MKPIIKFKHTLIYSEKLDEFAIIKEYFYGMIHIETITGQYEDLNSRIYFETGRPWKVIDEWYE